MVHRFFVGGLSLHGALRLVSSPRATNPLELRLKFVQIFVAHFLKVHQVVTRAFQCADDFVELKVHRASVAGLCIMDRKYHHEGESGLDCNDEEMQCSVVMESST